MQLDIVNSENKKVGALDVRDDVFGGPVNADLMWESVVHANAARRRGTHMTKNRSLVSGSGKKPWRQKGTGRARVGSSRNPIWRHGGVAHGPTPRTYSFHLPRKMILGALRSALTDKYNGNAITVVDEFSLQNHKSKELRKRLDAIELNKKL